MENLNSFKGSAASVPGDDPANFDDDRSTTSVSLGRVSPSHLNVLEQFSDDDIPGAAVPSLSSSVKKCVDAYLKENIPPAAELDGLPSAEHGGDTVATVSSNDSAHGPSSVACADMSTDMEGATCDFSSAVDGSEVIPDDRQLKSRPDDTAHADGDTPTVEAPCNKTPDDQLRLVAELLTFQQQCRRKHLQCERIGDSQPSPNTRVAISRYSNYLLNGKTGVSMPNPLGDPPIGDCSAADKRPSGSFAMSSSPTGQPDPVVKQVHKLIAELEKARAENRQLKAQLDFTSVAATAENAAVRHGSIQVWNRSEPLSINFTHGARPSFSPPSKKSILGENANLGDSRKVRDSFSMPSPRVSRTRGYQPANSFEIYDEANPEASSSVTSPATDSKARPRKPHVLASHSAVEYLIRLPEPDLNTSPNLRTSGNISLLASDACGESVLSPYNLYRHLQAISPGKVIHEEIIRALPELHAIHDQQAKSSIYFKGPIPFQGLKHDDIIKFSQLLMDLIIKQFDRITVLVADHQKLQSARMLANSKHERDMQKLHDEHAEALAALSQAEDQENGARSLRKKLDIAEEQCRVLSDQRKENLLTIQHQTDAILNRFGPRATPEYIARVNRLLRANGIPDDMLIKAIDPDGRSTSMWEVECRLAIDEAERRRLEAVRLCNRYINLCKHWEQTFAEVVEQAGSHFTGMNLGEQVGGAFWAGTNESGDGDTLF